MLNCLTNISRHPLRRAIVKAASKKSGIPVELRDGPMPRDTKLYGGYDPSQHPNYDHIYTHKPFKEHRRFWRMYDRLCDQIGVERC